MSLPPLLTAFLLVVYSCSLLTMQRASWYLNHQPRPRVLSRDAVLEVEAVLRVSCAWAPHLPARLPPRVSRPPGAGGAWRSVGSPHCQQGALLRPAFMLVFEASVLPSRPSAAGSAPRRWLLVPACRQAPALGPFSMRMFKQPGLRRELARPQSRQAEALVGLLWEGGV